VWSIALRLKDERSVIGLRERERAKGERSRRALVTKSEVEKEATDDAILKRGDLGRVKLIDDYE
jgi:hypothetical protein